MQDGGLDIITLHKLWQIMEGWTFIKAQLQASILQFTCLQFLQQESLQ